MATVWCGCSPEEDLSMILEIKERSTKGFSLDRKNSYSISLTSLLLSHEINISVTNIREFGMSHSAVKGENSSFMILFSSSLDGYP